MAVPIAPLMDHVEDLHPPNAKAHHYDWSYEHLHWSQANHRWYLLMTFWARLFMQCGEWLRVPGWLQSLMIMLPVIIPNQSVDFCQKDSSTPVWAKYALTMVFRTEGGGCPMFTRWFAIYTMCYVWSYHFLRPLVNAVTKHLPTGPTWAGVSLAASMFLGVAAAAIHYPFSSVDAGTHMQWLPYEVSIGFIQPMLFALAMTQFPFDLQWWGNTSLGCYVFHFYFRTRMTELIMSLVSVFSFDPTGLLLFAAILAVCIFIQTTVGPLGHYILVGLQYIPSMVMKLLPIQNKKQQAKPLPA